MAWASAKRSSGFRKGASRCFAWRKSLMGKSSARIGTSVRAFGVRNAGSTLQEIQLRLRGGRRFFVTAGIEMANLVGCGAFGGNACYGTNHATGIPRRNAVAKGCPCRLRNVFFHARSAEGVRAGVEAGQGSIQAELDPGHLEIRYPRRE